MLCGVKLLNIELDMWETFINLGQIKVMLIVMRILLHPSYIILIIYWMIITSIYNLMLI